MLDRVEFGAQRGIDHAAAKLDHQPADDGGMKVSYVEYQYNWKPTEILTAGKYQALRDAMRQHLAEVEPKLKIPVVMRAKLGLFTDGWSLVGPG